MSTNPEIARELIKRNDRLVSDRRAFWDPTWQDISDYMAPRKSNIVREREPGRRQTDFMFDGTAVKANELLAASIQGSLTSAAIRWFSLRVRGIALKNNKDVNLWLEQSAVIVYDALRQSNFASEIHEAYLDLGAFGTAGIFVPEPEMSASKGFPGLRFQALPIGGYTIDEDSDGRVDTVFYPFKLTGKAALEKWGDKLPETTQKKAQDKPNEMIEFLHVAMPREVDLLLRKNKKGATRMPWASYHIDVKAKAIISESGFHEFPYLVPRWSKVAGEMWGRGPGYTALPDVRTLNKLVELKLKALAKNIDPPVMVRDEGVIGAVRLTPGGLTHVRDMEAVKTLDLTGRFDITQLEESSLQQKVEKVFFSDQLQLREGPQMTALEVQVRFELMQRFLGPTLGRLESELLNPLIQRVFDILTRAKVLSEPPEEILAAQEAMGGSAQIVDIEYEGPLARAQRVSDSVATQRFLSAVLPMAESSPNVLDLIDMDEMVRVNAHAAGVPATVLRSKEEVAKTRQERASREKAQRDLEQAQLIATTAGKGAPMAKVALDAAREPGLAGTVG